MISIVKLLLQIRRRSKNEERKIDFMSSVASTMAVLTAIGFGKNKNNSKSKQLTSSQKETGPSLEFMLEADKFVKDVKVEHCFPKRKVRQKEKNNK